MGRIHGKIKIELMSDLCIGSGYSYGGVIDSDVAYDQLGFPQIPARRLKGCMREAAELVCPEAAEALFGKSGKNTAGDMALGNGLLEDHDAMKKEILELRYRKREEAFWLNPQNILKIYTEIRAQTSICQDTGVAEETTLRYTRVVKQYGPQKEKIPLCFYAEVEFDQSWKTQMERILKAVRNMGMNRSRGLGSVRCSLISQYIEDEQEKAQADGSEERRVSLAYVLCNQEPLLISSDNAGVSDSYISGKSILGTLAGAYLQRNGADSQSEEFRHLFLDGSTIFTDANITFPMEMEGEKGTQWPDYYPAPLYLNRLKKTKALVNLLADRKDLPKEKEKAYDLTEGNLPKKLKTYYVYEAAPNTFCIAEPDREICYHNSHMKLLYSQEAVTEGQYFRGKIYTDKKYAKLLKELLEKSPLSFGKSKAAQYGACLLAGDVVVEDVREKTAETDGGERLAVVFCSDAIFLDGESGYTVRFERVKELTAKQLGISYDKTMDEGSIIQTKEITGYHTTWNLRKPGVPAVKAGSVLVYTIPAGKGWERTVKEDQVFVGERNREGYGHVRIARCKDMAYGADELERIPTAGNKTDENVLCRCRPFLLKILRNQLLERLIFQYTRKRPKLELTAAMIGRLDLMLLESFEVYGSDPEQALRDFCSRVQSIKRKKERERVFGLLQKLVLKDGWKEEVFEPDFEKMTDIPEDKKLKDAKRLLKIYVTEKEYREMLAGIWGEYMENILTYHKYRKKHEGGEGQDE